MKDGALLVAAATGVRRHYWRGEFCIYAVMFGRKFRLAFFAVIMILPSCALLLRPTPEKQPVQFEKRTASLMKYTSGYQNMISWGHYDEAVKYLRSSDGTKILTDITQIARYRVTDYDVKKRLLTDDGEEAWVVATIEYYELDDGLLSTLRDEQFWWYDEVEKRWYLESVLPQFWSE